MSEKTIVGFNGTDVSSEAVRWAADAHLVHHSPCPVVVVRGAASRGAPVRVVVGVDGSPASVQALRWAGDEADRHGVEVVVGHAWDYPYQPTGVGSAQGRDLTEVNAACTLDSAVEAARERCAAVVTPALVEGGAVDSAARHRS